MFYVNNISLKVGRGAGREGTNKNKFKNMWLRTVYILYTNPFHTVHSGMQSQVSLRKHHYEQSYRRWWNSSWAISNPKRWCCESAATNMPANLENLAVITGLEKVRFHSNPKERQCQRMFKLPHNCPHLTC